MTDSANSGLFRQSHILLIFRLLAAEIVLMSLYLFIRLPKDIILIPFFDNLEDVNFLNRIGLLYFILMSIIELIMILQITLNWTNEEYEIREGSIIHRKGIFRLKEEIFSLRNLGSTKISQDLFGKIFNYGTIIVNSPILKQDVVLINIHNPKKVISYLEDNIEEPSTAGGQIIRRRG